MSKHVSVKPITVTIDPIDLDLIDRLAKLEGLNRSQEIRSMFLEMRPMLTATVEAFEAALKQRDLFNVSAQNAAVAGLEGLLPEVEALSRQYLGAMSRIEGASAATQPLDPRPSNNGGHTPTPTNPDSVND